MTRRGHYQTGIGLAMLAASAALRTGCSPAYAMLIMVVAMASAPLPDVLEIKRWRRGIRHCVIPHRTLTHWLAPWAALAWWLAWKGTGHVWMDAILLGIASGAIGHILMDWLTPMGVPVLSPLNRHSLHLVHSGNPATESLAATLLFACGIASLFFVV